MSQENVYNLLKKKKRWMRSSEITKILEVKTTNASLKKLHRYGEIMRREAKTERNKLIYEYKIK